MTTAVNSKTTDLIDALEKEVEKNGIVKDEVISTLKELREHYIAAQDPLVTRVVRQTAEYIEDNETFDIDLLSVEQVEEEDNLDEGGEDEESPVENSEAKYVDLKAEDSFEQIKENFKYLLELFRNNQNKMNREELQRVKYSYINMGMV